MRGFSWRIRRRRVEAQLDAELSFHLEQETNRYISAGFSAEEATRKARLEFGGLDQIKEECRDVRSYKWMADCVQDLRYGIRMLAKNPGLTFAVIVSLALGIGANTAIFSVVDAAVWRPLPYKDADRLVDIVQVEGRGTNEQASYSGMNREELNDWRTQKQVFEGIEAFSSVRITLFAGTPQAEDVRGERISPDMFAFLGTRPVSGRGFSAEDSRVRSDSVCVISEDLWRSAFGSDRSVLGKTVRLDAKVVTVIGIMPSTFKLHRWTKPKIWMPLPEHVTSKEPDSGEVGIIARLRPGMSFGQAQNQARMAADRLNREKPGRRKWDVDLEPYEPSLTGPLLTELYVLMGAVGFLLLAACANVASLLLSRASTRQREVAIRAAIGAGHWRLFRQFLLEGLLLSSAGAVVSIALAWYGIRLLPRLLPNSLLLFAVREASFDGRVLAFTGAVGILTGLVCSLAPASRAARTSVTEGLVVTNRITGSTPAVRRLLGTLQCAQVGFALVLLVGAGLMVNTFVRMLRTETGFDTDGLIQVSLSISEEVYPTRPQQQEFFDRLLAVVKGLPNVRSATIGSAIPAAASLACRFMPERNAGESVTEATADVFIIGPDYFGTVGVPLVAGRTFGREDGPTAPPVAIIDRGAAEHYWPGENVVGKRFRQGPKSPWLTIVGVAGRVKTPQFMLADWYQVYVPFSQQESRLFGSTIIRTTGDPSQILAAVRTQVTALDRTARIWIASTVEEFYGEAVATPRFYLTLLSLFAGIALVIASVGLYGMTMFTVSRRTQEIGLRIAIGACPTDVRSLVVRQAVVPVILGIGAGLIGAVYLTRFMRTLLYQIEPQDSFTLTTVSGVMLLIALISSYLPARRASRIDPIVALHQD
jgi:putative ABC transport system permease protein